MRTMRTNMPDFMTRYALNRVTEMKKMEKNIARWGAVVTAVGAIFMGGVSCKAVDDTFGTEFIPENQVVSIAMDSTFQIKTYNITTDSVISSHQSSGYVGTAVDPVCGLTNASLLFQYAPMDTFAQSDSLYGIRPTIDSVFLSLSLKSGFQGDIDVAQTFDLYELSEEIYIDSIYYSNFNPAPIVKSTPLATVEFEGGATSSGYLTTRITDPDYIARLIDTTGYNNPKAFHKRFKGFYLKPRVSNLAAATLHVDLDNSYMQINFHNENPTPDTTYTYFFFTTNSSTYQNQSISVINYDYTNASPALRLNDKSVPVETTYVQGFGGITTLLEFTKESVEQIRKRVLTAGFTDIVINKAKLQVNIADQTAAGMDRDYTRLGMYTSFTDYYNYTPILDYSPSMENQGYSTNYDGNLNRSRYLFEMDITYYAQRLFRQDYDQQEIVLATSNEYFYYLLNPMALHGYGSEAPLRLVLTYTMVR